MKSICYNAIQEDLWRQKKTQREDTFLSPQLSAGSKIFYLLLFLWIPRCFFCWRENIDKVAQSIRSTRGSMRTSPECWELPMGLEKPISQSLWTNGRWCGCDWHKVTTHRQPTVSHDTGDLQHSSTITELNISHHLQFSWLRKVLVFFRYWQFLTFHWCWQNWWEMSDENCYKLTSKMVQFVLIAGEAIIVQTG